MKFRAGLVVWVIAIVVLAGCGGGSGGGSTSGGGGGGGVPITLSNVRVLTYHNDIGRTGQNLDETALTTSNVDSTSFGLLGSAAVDGPVDAEPLYMGSLTVNGAAHNVLFVVT
ncbi:MAG TPA: hypothetical protein VIH46_03275, partial [Candidatus Acidoferrales bacterium]